MVELEKFVGSLFADSINEIVEYAKNKDWNLAFFDEEVGPFSTKPNTLAVWLNNELDQIITKFEFIK